MLGALRVMRPPAGAWSPLDLPSLVAWYDASDTATITSSGGAVSQWDDKSGNGYHLTQATGAMKPTTGSTTQNGLNTVSFDGTDLIANTSISLTQPNMVIIVCKFAASNAFVFDEDSGNSPRQILNRSSNWRLFAGAYADSGMAVDTAWHVFSCLFNGASSQLWVDGTGSGAINPGTENMTGMAFGGANSLPFTGEIGEFVACDPDLSAGDRQAAEAALSTKWGTP